MQLITIRRDIDDLNAQEWHFYFDDRGPRLVLQYYKRLTRETKRHKFIAAESYNRLDRRSGINNADDVPLPADVQTQAKNEFVSKITVGKS